MLNNVTNKDTAEAVKKATRDFPIACEALEARDTDQPFGRAEFDKWIGDFDVSNSAVDFEVALTKIGGLRCAHESTGQGAH